MPQHPPQLRQAAPADNIPRLRQSNADPPRRRQGGVPDRAPVHGQDADQAALQRFIALAERDEEDEWDSDEMLGDEQWHRDEDDLRAIAGPGLNDAQLLEAVADAPGLEAENEHWDRVRGQRPRGRGRRR